MAVLSAIAGPINRVLRGFGFELRRRAAPDTVYRNFDNLAMAYEHRLRERNCLIPVDDSRPERLRRLLGTPPSEAYFIVEALAVTAKVPGEVCEFGVAQGETSALIATEISGGSKKLHLYDSFEGLPKPTDKDELKDDIFKLGSMAAYEGEMSCGEHLVRGRLAQVGFAGERVHIHRGFIDSHEGLRKIIPASVSFAYVDFDFYEPIKIVLDELHSVLSPGGVVIVDDYDFFSTGVKLAVTEFIDAHGDDYQLNIPDPALGYFAVINRRS